MSSDSINQPFTITLRSTSIGPCPWHLVHGIFHPNTKTLARLRDSFLCHRHHKRYTAITQAALPARNTDCTWPGEASNPTTSAAAAAQGTHQRQFLLILNLSLTSHSVTLHSSPLTTVFLHRWPPLPIPVPSSQTRATIGTNCPGLFFIRQTQELS